MAATRRRVSSISFRQSRRINIEAQASVDVGNYNNRRFEGMLNIPIVDDQLDLRVAGEWTKRDGYTFDDDDSTRPSMAAICGPAA